jgi:hypothetical protein
MKKYSIKNSNFTYTALILTLLYGILQAGDAKASTLKIKNDDTAKVDIIIEPGDGSIVVADKNSIKLSLKQGQEKTVTVDKSKMEKDTFSVKGTVKLPSLYNKCGPLMVDRNYKIIFTGAKSGGTICIAETLN